MKYPRALITASGFAACVLPSIGLAGPIDAALSIVGTIYGNAVSVNVANTYSESLYSTVGGSTSAGAAGVSLTDTGDGWGHSASLTGDSSSTNTLFSLYEYSATNNSGTDTFELTFGITFDHTADADAGDLDARAISRLDAGIPFGDGGTTVEYLDKELESESGFDYAATHPTWQDRVNTVYVGTNGATLNEAATIYYTIQLLAGEAMSFEAEYLLSGRTFDTGASFNVENNMFIFLDSFVNLTNPSSGPGPEPTVPSPATPLLILVGLLAFRATGKPSQPAG
jgi:hypothetical protein